MHAERDCPPPLPLFVPYSPECVEGVFSQPYLGGTSVPVRPPLLGRAEFHDYLMVRFSSLVISMHPHTERATGQLGA